MSTFAEPPERNQKTMDKIGSDRIRSYKASRTKQPIGAFTDWECEISGYNNT